MYKLIGLLAATTLLTSCGLNTPNGSITLDNGRDTSFLQQGTTNCPAGTVQGGLTSTERYPLRCGPQAR